MIIIAIEILTPHDNVTQHRSSSLVRLGTYRWTTTSFPLQLLDGCPTINFMSLAESGEKSTHIFLLTLVCTHICAIMMEIIHYYY